MKTAYKKELKAFDLCSGIGGFRAGVMLSEMVNQIKFVAYSDIDEYAISAYNSMYDINDEICLGNIQNITRFENEFDVCGQLESSTIRIKKINDSIPDFDILFAGFPCQPHSLMGNRKGNTDSRGNLFYDIKEIINVKRPEYFILENVRAIKSVNNGEFFDEIINSLKNDLGYNITIWSLNAADYGIPQVRRRLFIIGSLHKKIPEQIPELIDLYEAEYPTTWHLLEKEVDDKYYISDKLLKTILTNQHKGYNRKAEINKLIARPICKTMHKMHRASQDNYFSDDYILGTYNKENSSVILAETSTSKIRRITPKEALRIQSFPENLIERLLKLGISDTRLYMLAGNAVPPKLVKSVLERILSTEDKKIDP